ncbi:MBL fold metallo-hydrolase [Erysipelothrix sp. HDW6C]|uniref:MBL fold metallo-hydrolase n=1 Tax=Erysipelothrix sp. HDW6C TaxID=2714930 RepID=UPI00140E73F1|nr:MBL fold metallo-hydrolase [Erysipelothrix sp. HDW6C]QIK70157.1 MBL fold metallo-hydrolase [Erysipelothrix sp. HDW6C]
MKIKKQVMGYVQTNTYYLEIDNKVLVVDPCLDPHNDAKRLLKPLEDKDVVGIILTHGHFDHISGVDAIVDIYHCPVFIYHEELHYLKNINANLSNQMPESVVIRAEATPIECEPMEIGPFAFDIIKTPGHTSGSISYIFGDDVIDGDFIFADTIGRTDLPTGSMAVMNDSIQMFVDEFAGMDITLYPGHGEITTLEQELKSNSFLKI